MTLDWEPTEKGDGTSVRRANLSGHFWAELETHPISRTWSVTILDYDNNVMARAVGLPEATTLRLVENWDNDVRMADVTPVPLAYADE